MSEYGIRLSDIWLSRKIKILKNRCTKYIPNIYVLFTQLSHKNKCVHIQVFQICTFGLLKIVEKETKLVTKLQKYMFATNLRNIFLI